MNTLSFSKAARANILSIGRYTEQTWGVKQRDIYLGKLFAAFEKLRKSPEHGKPRDELFKGILCLRAEKHVVYYFFRKKERSIHRRCTARTDGTIAAPPQTLTFTPAAPVYRAAAALLYRHQACLD